MRDIQPPIWRLLRVPDAYTLHQLHRVLQVVFSRLDSHLYAFEIDGRRYQLPNPDWDLKAEDSARTRLRDLELGAGAEFVYVYDFGDDWRHDVRVEKVMPMPPEHGRDWSPRLLEGARAAPPEDVGGLPGYARMLEALADPGHPEHGEFRRGLPSSYAPERFDAWALDQALALVVGWGAI